MWLCAEHLRATTWDRETVLSRLAFVPLRLVAASLIRRTLAPFVPFRALGHFDDSRRAALCGAARDPLLGRCVELAAAHQNKSKEEGAKSGHSDLV